MIKPCTMSNAMATKHESESAALTHTGSVDITTWHL